ncbi:MAG: 4'-phosphopantetheinyl transferase superfamily protein [Proteobacteria bacterium]|nr:4'-phosphopantetheinyl transferase superfamily protein [Pseudomonadota bacterium]
MFFSSDNVTIFILNLKDLRVCVPLLTMYLSDAEKEKAKKFLFDYLKEDYLISHGILRILLSQYLSCAPFDVQYVYNDFQKPFCKNNPKLHFNISHSKDVICYAFSYDHEIGIDIEFMDNKIPIKNLCSLIASQKELKIYNKVNKDKVYLFYKLWTLKEAFLKALGTGLSRSPSNIETTILPKEIFKVIQMRDSEEEIKKNWTFCPLHTLPNYLGAVAVRKKNAFVNIINLTSSQAFFSKGILNS